MIRSTPLTACDCKDCESGCTYCRRGFHSRREAWDKPTPVEVTGPAANALTAFIFVPFVGLLIALAVTRAIHRRRK